MFNFISKNYNAGVNQGSGKKQNSRELPKKVESKQNISDNAMPKPKIQNVVNHGELLHKKQLQQLRKETRYIDCVYCGVWIDWDHMFHDNNNNSNIIKPHINEDLSIPISSVNIPNFDHSIEMECKQYINTLMDDDKQEESKWIEWKNNYEKKKEIKKNVIETAKKSGKAAKSGILFITKKATDLLYKTSKAINKSTSNNNDNNTNTNNNSNENDNKTENNLMESQIEGEISPNNANNTLERKNSSNKSMEYAKKIANDVSQKSIDFAKESKNQLKNLWKSRKNLFSKKNETNNDENNDGNKRE